MSYKTGKSRGQQMKSPGRPVFKFRVAHSKQGRAYRVWRNFQDSLNSGVTDRMLEKQLLEDGASEFERRGKTTEPDPRVDSDALHHEIEELTMEWGFLEEKLSPRIDSRAKLGQTDLGGELTTVRELRHVYGERQQHEDAIKSTLISTPP